MKVINDVHVTETCHNLRIFPQYLTSEEPNTNILSGYY